MRLKFWSQWKEKDDKKERKTKESFTRNFSIWNVRIDEIDSWLNQVPPSSHVIEIFRTVYTRTEKILIRASTTRPSQQIILIDRLEMIDPWNLSFVWTLSISFNQTMSQRKIARIPAEHHRPLYTSASFLIHILYTYYFVFSLAKSFSPFPWSMGLRRDFRASGTGIS